MYNMCYLFLLTICNYTDIFLLVIKLYYSQIFHGPYVKSMLPEVATAGKEEQNSLDMPRNPPAGTL
jgi:hypothetical protein